MSDIRAIDFEGSDLDDFVSQQAAHHQASLEYRASVEFELQRALKEAIVQFTFEELNEIVEAAIGFKLTSVGTAPLPDCIPGLGKPI